MLLWSTFNGFLGMCGVWSCVFVALTLLALPVPAQVLTVPLVQSCRGGGFLPPSAIFALVLGLFLLFKEFLVLALVFLGYS